ncbi:MAG TPA: methylglyoxal synthase [Spirochaetales bacterium]|nr:methylglyoxal synthase [Spirochaetales bacterium]HRY53806.1 methylglyoxal synthase [Spirochaetia bacterium]HRZ65107.1 methylglyoxal synthase [Spirochaetia bacterium]
MEKRKRIALVAHDNKKRDLAEWVQYNWGTLMGHELVCTGTTGKMVEETIRAKAEAKLPQGFQVRRLKSGPLGGDQQLGALIAEGEVDIVIFFWDPMSPQPHDVDVKALLRIAVLYNIPMACNRSSADFVISSELLGREYHQRVEDYSSYLARSIPR